MADDREEAGGGVSGDSGDLKSHRPSRYVDHPQPVTLRIYVLWQIQADRLSYIRGLGLIPEAKLLFESKQHPFYLLSLIELV